MNEAIYLPLFLLSFFIAIFTLRKNRLFNNQPHKVGVMSITGLRGLLATMVIFSHFYMEVYSSQHVWIYNKDYFELFGLGNALVNFGKFGVAMFFMISGFLFYRMIDKPKLDVGKFLTSRIKRLAPLYFFVVSIVLASALLSGDVYNINDFTLSSLRWMLFIGNYNIDGFNASHVTSGVEWTLRIEWLLYFSIPFLFIATKRFPGKIFRYSSVLMSILIIFIIAVIIREYGHVYTDPRPVIAFFSGFVAYEASKIKFTFSYKITSSIALSLLIIAVFTSSNNFMYLFFIVLLTIPFIAICQGVDIFGFLNKKPLLSLGEISYSMYLTHGIVLYLASGLINSLIGYSHLLIFILCPAYFIIVIIISSLSYRFIEMPFMQTVSIKGLHGAK